MLDRKQTPKIVDAVDMQIKLPPYQKYTLDNGVEIFSIDAGEDDVMMIEWVFTAGVTQEEQKLVAGTTNFLLRNGTTKKNAFQINEYFDYYGAYLNRSCYSDTATITLHTLSKHVDKLLPEVRTLITESVMPEDELAIFKQNRKQRLKLNLKKSDFIAGRLIDSYLFGESHPYGRFSSDEDFDALERDALLRFYEKYYQQGKLRIFVAGKLPENINSLLNTYFGDLPFGDIKVKEFPITPAVEKKSKIINDPNGIQSSIKIARLFPTKRHPDYAKAYLLNTILGGYFGSRLMMNIREDKGYTYGIYSMFANLRQQSAWIISTEAGKEVSDATIAETYKEMKRLREEPVSNDELNLVRNFIMGLLLGYLNGSFNIIMRWKDMILHHLDESHFYQLVQTIQTVTAEELQELAQKYLQPEDFYELVVV